MEIGKYTVNHFWEESDLLINTVGPPLHTAPSQNQNRGDCEPSVCYYHMACLGKNTNLSTIVFLFILSPIRHPPKIAFSHVTSLPFEETDM